MKSDSTEQVNHVLQKIHPPGENVPPIGPELFEQGKQSKFALVLERFGSSSLVGPIQLVFMRGAVSSTGGGRAMRV